MIEKIMKTVKGGNKKRSRNITIGAVVGFLLSCTAVMGATDDKYLYIKEGHNGIEFSTNSKTEGDGVWSSENPYENDGNIWDKDTESKTYTNNITLSSSEANGKGTYENKDADISYGLRLSGDLTGVNFINNGSIIGIISIIPYNGAGVGAGIYNSGTMENITNTGIISSTSTVPHNSASASAGIYNSKGTIKDITNTGVISNIVTFNSEYSISLSIGYGIYNSGTIENITNTGIISGTSDYSNSYEIYNSGTMENITNTGVITSSGDLEGYGIYNTDKIVNIINIGIISGTGVGEYNPSSFGIGAGIYNSGTMENITNTGIISGTGKRWDKVTETGYGIHNKSEIGNITNAGIISASSISKFYEIYHGIYNDSSAEIKDIANTGIISGHGTSSGTNSSIGTGLNYGIYNGSSAEIKNITNTGIISGYGTGTNSGTGYGIYNDLGAEIKNITNTGVVYGKTNAIKNDKDIQNNTGTITATNNYGILVNGDDGKKVVDGLTVVDETPTDNQILNKGLIFTALDTGKYKADEDEYKKFGQTYVDENVIIDYQKDGTGKPDLNNPITKEYTIINAKALGDDEESITGTESLKLENGTLSYNDSRNNHKEENISSGKGYILNGITNTLEVSGKNNELDVSVINAYKTAVVMNGKESMLTLNSTVVNGGVEEDGDVSTIEIGGENNTLTLKGESTVNTGTEDNVAITVGGENNALILEGNAKVNGKMESTGTNNLISLNGNARNGMNIHHDISGFTNMNIDNNVTFFEDVKVTGTKKVTIAETGTLNLRLKNTGATEKVDGMDIPKATHAFSGSTGMIIQGEGNGVNIAGTLKFITNGIGKKIYVDMKDIELRNLYFKTSSIIDGYKVNDKVSVILGAYENLDKIYKPENTRKGSQNSNRYESLNNIYKGIYSSKEDNLNALRVLISFDSSKNNYDESTSDEEQLKNLMSYLGSIYTETPYSYSSELSRKSMEMFRDIVTENQFRPDLNRWLIMGGLTHRDGGTKDTYYGKNYHGFDTGTVDADVDMKLTGAYALGKYGYSENVSLGVTAGGNKSEAKLPMSKVKGNSGYVGAFAENYRGNLTLKAGAGIQYSEYDANRATLGGHSYSEKYSDMAYDIYLNGRYSNPMGDNFFLEPYGTLSYTYVDQEGADEGSKVLAIETDSKSFDYTAAKVGVDLKKVIPHEKGKSTLSAGVSYTRLLNGADKENITGRFKGGSDFDILVAHKNEHSIGLNAKYALELENGVLFDVKGSYNVERDSHNGSGKNRAKGEWIVGAGIGYKF